VPEPVLAFGGEEDDRDAGVGRRLAQFADHRQPVHARHVEVGDDKVEAFGAALASPSVSPASVTA
jgi:predicted aconitase